MLFLGHIGLTAFASSMLYLPILGAVVGVLLPDIIDKGLFTLGYALCSRFIAHSVFFFPVAGIVSYIITRNKKFALAVAFGALLHLAEDMHDDVPLLYPLKDYAFFNTCGQIKVVFSPYVIITEAIGGLVLILMSVFNSQLARIRQALWRMIMRVVK